MMSDIERESLIRQVASGSDGKLPLNLVEISDDLMSPQYSEIIVHDASRPVSGLLSIYLELISLPGLSLSGRLLCALLQAAERVIPLCL
jgi:hypothetical protein